MLPCVERGIAWQAVQIAGLRYAGRRTIFSSFGLSSASASDQTERYHERKILPYRQGQLYDVVADVDAYHRFIPYCTASRVLTRETEDKHVKLRAELKVAFMGFEEQYISNVECRPYESVQAVASTEIPLFKSLVTTWRFQPAASSSPHPTADLAATLLKHAPTTFENGPTLVTFDLEYAFADPLHAYLSAAFLGRVSKMMVRAFEERCLEVHGPGKK